MTTPPPLGTPLPLEREPQPDCALDLAFESRFQPIVELLTEITGCPIATVNCFTEADQIFIARTGLSVGKTSREVAFCNSTLLQGDLMVIPDTLQDPRFSNNPLVLGPPYLRFYAGLVLKSPQGTALGTLCLLDSQPRAGLDPQHERVLRIQGALLLEIVHAEQKWREATQSVQQVRHTQEFRRGGYWSWSSREGLFVDEFVLPLLGWDQQSRLSLPKALSTVHKQDRTRLRKALFQTLRQGIPLRLEFRIAVGPEQWAWCEVQGKRRFDGSKRPELYGTLMNIDQLKQAELERWYWEKQQIQKDAIDQTIAMLAHQWRQPLSIISLQASNIALLNARTAQHPVIADKAQAIQQQAQELSKLLNLLKGVFENFSHPLQAVSLRELLEETARDWSSRLQDAQISLELDLVESGRLWSHPEVIRSVLDELIQNAVDALTTPAASQPRLLQLKLSVVPQGQQVLVIDNGPGIPAALRSRIFEPYTSSKQQRHGVGLGLYLSQLLSNFRLKGTLSALDSAQGACFQLKLPNDLRLPLQSHTA